METLHDLVALGGVMLQSCLSRKLDEGSYAGQRGVDHLTKDVGQLGAGDRVTKSPAAHAVRLAEGVGGDDLVHEARLGQKRMMSSLPHHVAIRLVTEYDNVAALHQLPQTVQVLRSSHSPRWVVRRVKKKSLGARSRAQKSFHVIQIRPKMILFAKHAVNGLRTPSFDVRPVGGKMRRENQHRVPGIEESLAEELLENFGTGTGHDVVGRDLDTEFAAVVGGHGFAK